MLSMILAIESKMRKMNTVPSYVLRALGLKDELAHSSIRFAVGRFTTEEDINYTLDLVKDSVGKLREISPLWDMYKDGVDMDSIEWAAN